MSKKRFVHYPNRPKKLTAEFINQEYAKLLMDLPAAESSTTPELWLELFSRRNALISYISSEASRIGFAYSANTTNKKMEAANKYVEERIEPAFAKPDMKIIKAFVASQHRQAVADRYGQMLIVEAESVVKILSPVNIPLDVKLNRLATKYYKLVAGAKVRVRGKTVNLPTLRSYSFSPDRALRKEAYLAGSKWFNSKHKTLSEIYAEMVRLRHQEAVNLKMQNYIPYSYIARSRHGYGHQEVANFRSLVRKHLVPLMKEVHLRRAQELGDKKLKYWDIMYDPASEMQMGITPVSKQMANTSKLFKKMSPIFSKHFEFMRRHKLIDLETRPNKQGGGYSTDFTDENKSVIFLNSTGDPDDVTVITHEMGHAIQSMESFHIESVELQQPSHELAEVFSMGLEFLVLPYMEIFFDKENSRKFTLKKWHDTLYYACYICIVDEFQHWVYKHPKASPNNRDKAWALIFKRYFPAVDFSGYEQYKSVRWYAQSHIFVSPFYYIDYALAEMAAVQLAVMAEKNHAKTLKSYLKLCKLGGTRTFVDALKLAGLESPFSEKLMIKVKKKLAKELLA